MSTIGDDPTVPFQRDGEQRTAAALPSRDRATLLITPALRPGPARASGRRLRGLRRLPWPMLAGGAALLPRTARAEVPTPFLPASPQAAAIADLFWLIIGIATVIFIGVMAVLLYASFAYRERPGRQPAQFAGNLPLEITWTGLPTLLLLIIFILTIRTMSRTSPPAGDPLEITVVAHQWWWEIRYPEGFSTANEIHVPVGEPVLIHLESADVIHSFWVPQLAGKTDANPGHHRLVWFTPTRVGTFAGQCAEFCGVQHTWMLIRVVVETPTAYQAWVRHERGPAATPTGLALRGKQVFDQQACGSCHTIAGTAANGVAGPDLTHVASRATIGGGVLPNTPEMMRRWLTDPQAVKPGALMPNFKLTPDEVQALAAYMESLH